MSGISGLPSVPDTALPAAVRSGSQADKTAYKAAMGFEQILTGELVKGFVASSPELADGPRADLVNDTLASALESAGGLGLAPQLYAAIKRSAAA